MTALWLTVLGLLVAVFAWAMCRMGKVEPPLPGCSEDEFSRKKAQQ